jgi:hypothetical protein
MKTVDARAIEAALAFIKANFSSLREGIKCLQEKGAMREESLALVKKITSDLEKVPGGLGKMVSRKMKSVLDKNSGYETLCSISRILTR